MLYMVTFTINIPSMLAYIPALWILWVITWMIIQLPTGTCTTFTPHLHDYSMLYPINWTSCIQGNHRKTDSCQDARWRGSSWWCCWVEPPLHGVLNSSPATPATRGGCTQWAHQVVGNQDTKKLWYPWIAPLKNAVCCWSLPHLSKLNRLSVTDQVTLHVLVLIMMHYHFFFSE